MNRRDYLSVRLNDPSPISNINLMTVYPDFNLSTHAHPFYHINRILEGSVTVLVDGREHTLDAGCIFVLPPRLSHALYSERGYMQIGVDVECVADARGLFEELEAICPGFAVKRLPISPHVARERAEQMRALLSNQTKGNTMRALNLAEGQVLDLLEALRREGDDGFAERFAAMVAEHDPWSLTLSDMCRILCTSRTQLEKKAKYAFGCGASEYCARLRYARVCEYLKEDLTLDAIAARTGFYDACHLSRFFSSRAGMTPGEFRRGMK
ncbi:MAG: AraC family transcriptional regulator [Clostridia bacterium]|nr:AraC family transcriptional regulator [Clostridia bacterium]MBQ9785780.1 AraC family transcriptional regulator [Clostridia bacterium]